MESVRDHLNWDDFNKTEPETLAKLMGRAVDEGGSARRELQELNKQSQRLLPWCREERLLQHAELGVPPKEVNGCLVGIDGSCQQLGGPGGIWYVFVSAAQVVFRAGLRDTPEVFPTADIIRLQERDFQKVGFQASLAMMQAECKAIASWGSQQIASFVMIDGPIADPPTMRGEYVSHRCAAIRACLNQGIPVIGVVKRTVDTQFLNHWSAHAEQTRPEFAAVFSRYINDGYLLGHLMTLLLHESDGASYCVSHAFDVSRAEQNGGVLSEYLAEGVGIAVRYVMASVASPLVRIEVAMTSDATESDYDLAAATAHAARVVLHCTYPGQHIPLPVQLAHEKSNIRQGCAEVLYYEIMTAQMVNDASTQILMSKLR